MESSSRMSARSRGRWYAFFAEAFFTAPNRAWLERLRTPDFQADLEEVCGGGPGDRGRGTGDRTEGLNPEPCLLPLAPPGAEVPAATVDAVAAEFEALFQVPMGRYVTPYESVYCDVRHVSGYQLGGLLMGPSTQAVQQCYRAAGVQFDDRRFREPPDHISAELAFLASLCDQEDRFEADGDERAAKAHALQGEFLRRHLLRWAFRFVERIGEKARDPFYPALGKAFAAFLRAEQRHLDLAAPAPVDARAGPLDRAEFKRRTRTLSGS